MAFELITEVFSFQQIQENIDIKAGKVVLDIGCGEPSLFTLMANSMFFPSYIGVDVRVEPLLKFGNNKNCIVIPDNIITSDIFYPNSVSVINFTEVLEHIPKIEGVKVLSKIYELLLPSGLLILTTPIKPKEVDIDMDKEKEDWDHISYYEYDQLLRLLEIVGFSIENYFFNKFLARKMTYLKVLKAMTAKYGDIGAEIFNTIKSIWGQRIAGTIFSTYAGDIGGHIQILARRK
jgi:SAM-dependent methyltransferase